MSRFFGNPLLVLYVGIGLVAPFLVVTLIVHGYFVSFLPLGHELGASAAAAMLCSALTMLGLWLSIKKNRQRFFESVSALVVSAWKFLVDPANRKELLTLAAGIGIGWVISWFSSFDPMLTFAIFVAIVVATTVAGGRWGIQLKPFRIVRI